MSAAEKLKALDEHGFPVVTDAALRRSLPQIVAVVEAAEIEPFAFVENETRQEAVAVSLKEWRTIQAALSALDEKLNGAERSPTPERT